VRVTPAEVATIIPVEASVDVTPYIEAASLIVSDVCSNSDYSDAKLKMIELWLSAHFYAVREPTAAAERAGSVGATYDSKVDLAFCLTRYGQQALLLDTEGYLAALQRQAIEGRRTVSASANWLGKDIEKTWYAEVDSNT
jgi:hypothetical protein